MKNPFIAPDIREIMNDKLSARNHAIALMLAGAVLVLLLLGCYYLAVTLGVFPRFGGPVASPASEEQVAPEVPADQGRSIEERLAEFEEGVYDPAAIEDRVEQFGVNADSGNGTSTEGRSMEERLKEFGQ